MLMKTFGTLVSVTVASATVLSLAGCSAPSDSAAGEKAVAAGPACNRQCLLITPLGIQASA